jgi:hypothetical protein
VWGRLVCKGLEGLGVLAGLAVVVVVAVAAGPRVIGIAAQPLRGLLAVLPTQPHTEDQNVSDLPDDTEEGWSVELPTDECERFDFDQGSFGVGIAELKAKELHTAELNEEAGRGDGTAKNNVRSTLGCWSQSQGAPLRA